MKTVTMLNTQVANIASMIAAIKRLGAQVQLTDDAQTLADATYAIIPGVGAFGPGIEQLDRMKVRQIIRARFENNRPTLCVCLGLQMLCLDSQESPGVEGLGILDVHVVRFNAPDILIPQLGWNHVQPTHTDGLLEPGYAYFANSYHLDAVPEGWRGAMSHHGVTFPAAIEKGALLACQFHPELSGRWGLSLMQRWLESGDL